MRSYQSAIVSVVLFALGAYWAYTFADSIINRTDYIKHLESQVFPAAWIPGLSWILPAGNLVIVLLLAFHSGQRPGALLSALLFALTALYAGLVYAGVFRDTPCNCIGVVRNLSWSGHLFLNLAGTVLSVIGLVLAGRGKEAVMSG
ncbi:hypothetical protein C7T94_02290 [Pedobacter yulinensis]|uniref:Methylamine utilisation protein MauE domain-containing protein n=1 Tax=Pedobacter yulinensis TaxID=2126353 RepID=A0A2T3HR80_9SPHI|nr:MauE/DoxX family redox-associated membrane protein [Pedobacter yulinensis]PST84970.1 hypothetical protein C7T94_02290 [Pedobacter yulinensis]